MNLCQTVKRQLKGKLRSALNRTLDNSHEHGFAICDVGSLKAGDMVEGNSQSVVIPQCRVGNAIGMAHSHRHSPEMEERFGRNLARKYFGNPSAQDLSPVAAPVKFGCVISSDQLVCHKKPKRMTSEIQILAEKELEANGAFAMWANSQITDGQFRQVVRDTVRAQEQAMRSSGGFCRIKL